MPSKYSEEQGTHLPPDIWVCPWCGREIKNAGYLDSYYHKQKCDAEPKGSGAGETDW